MTNLDVRPDEIHCRPTRLGDVELVEPRTVPLGGIRAMNVRRTLPARTRPFIGPWCFLDHYGPDDVGRTGGMDVAPHPHCGLQTVSWLFRGEIDHRDSLGTRALVLPGELNLMTAGRGIAHSEVSTRATTVLHGVQLWVALPPDRRDAPPAFLHYPATARTEAGVEWRVFLGEVGGETSPVQTFSPMVGAELAFGAGAAVSVPLDPGFEHGVLVDSAVIEVDGTAVPDGTLAALPAGRRTVRLHAPHGRARALLIGGAPMESELVMWWNFVGGSHDEIVEARRQWQAEIGAEDDGGGSRPPAARFGTVLGYDGAPLPAPRLPGGRLRSRGRRSGHRHTR